MFDCLLKLGIWQHWNSGTYMLGESSKYKIFETLKSHYFSLIMS